MCHKFIVPGVLILRFANILEIPANMGKQEPAESLWLQYGKEIVSLLSTEWAFLDGKYIVVKIL